MESLTRTTIGTVMQNRAGDPLTVSGPASALVSAEPAHAVLLPRFPQIEPVGQCNLRCRMCPIQFRRDGPPHGLPAFLPYDEFCRLIDEAPDVTELHLQRKGF